MTARQMPQPSRELVVICLTLYAIALALFVFALNIPYDRWDTP